MAVTIFGGIEAEFDLTLRNPIDLSGPTDPLRLIAQWSVSHGTGANQADLSWHGRVTLAPSSSTDLDLVGTLKDAFNVTFSPARIKFFAVACPATNGAAIDIGDAASAPFLGFLTAGSTCEVEPGGVFAICAPDAVGWPVTGGVNDRVKFFVGGVAAAVIADVIVIGASV